MKTVFLDNDCAGSAKKEKMMITRKMKSAFLVALAVLFLCACRIAAGPTLTPAPINPPTQTIIPVPTPTQLSSLRYDGLYQSVQPDNSSMYLRFYTDGTVLSVGSTGNPVQVAMWLNKAYRNGLKGQYGIRDSILEFTVTNMEGVVDYTGTIHGDELTLDIYSHINGYKATSVYHFVKIPSLQP
jgi:hypothetical protein